MIIILLAIGGLKSYTEYYAIDNIDWEESVQPAEVIATKAP